MVMVGLVQCDGCEGCGYVADTSTREPWVYYTRYLVNADGTPLFPEVRRVYCNKCKGTGRIFASRRADFRRKKSRD
jgi:hypothetical protein